MNRCFSKEAVQMVKCEGYGEIRALVHGCWERTVVQPLWETVWQLHIEFRKSESYPYDPEIPFLIPRGLKTCPHRNVCVHSVHSSIVHSYQNMATTQMAISRGLDKRDVGCPYSGVFLSRERSRSSDPCHSRGENMQSTRSQARTPQAVWFM